MRQGNSFIVWNGFDGNDWEIYWVKMDAAGIPGSVEKISIHRDNIPWNDYNPQIAADAVGTSYVVWEGYDRNDQEIYWVKITVIGTPGTVQKISTHEDNINGHDRDPKIAVDAAGTSYITWNGFDGTDQEIYYTVIITFVEPTRTPATTPDKQNP